MLGLGKNAPNPAENFTLEDGTIVPLGKPYKTDVQGALLYNEFIVYDVSQIRARYLLRLKFNYK